VTDRCRVAIVGAGPQGLTAAVHLVAAGIDPSDLVVVDPAGGWLGRWRGQFVRLGIAHLRSPAVHHPHPDPYALVGYAAAHGRSAELHRRYGLPGTALFSDFCQDLIAGSGLAGVVQQGEVVEVTADGGITLGDGRRFSAAHVVWCTNPSVPAWEGEGRAGVQPWEWVDVSRPPATVAVVGGGLTAAHLVERALEGGSRVEWISRRPVVERDFDTDPGWLGPKEMAAFAALVDPARRLDRVVEARGGGTVPSWMMEGLRIAEHSGRLCRRVGAVAVEAAAHGSVVRVDGSVVEADAVWGATGDHPRLAAAPALHRLCDRLGVEVVGGRPVLDEWLRLPGSVVQVAGRLAQLQLGPTAGNLAGARRAAERVVGAVLGVHAMYALADARL